MFIVQGSLNAVPRGRHCSISTFLGPDPLPLLRGAGVGKLGCPCALFMPLIQYISGKRKRHSFLYLKWSTMTLLYHCCHRSVHYLIRTEECQTTFHVTCVPHYVKQVGLFKLGGEVFAYFLVDKTGRRPLFLTSSGLVTVFLIILGTLFVIFGQPGDLSTDRRFRL